jgi:hypothetical protein
MAWTFYQLTSLEGDKPLAYFRYDGKSPQFWNGSAWKPSEVFLDKLSSGDPMLDKLSSDPTITKSDDSRTIIFVSQDAQNANNPLGSVTLTKGVITNAEGCAEPFVTRYRRAGLTDEGVFSTLSDNWSNGYFLTFPKPE